MASRTNLKKPLNSNTAASWLCGRESIMQNKANLQQTEMSATFCDKRDYENNSAFGVQKNKAKSKPISNAETVQWCEESHPTGLAGRNIAPPLGALQGRVSMDFLSGLCASLRVSARCARSK